MLSVHQHWDPLKTCIVGRSYAPEFYSYISNSRVRAVLERIAAETEEDYQLLIAKLQGFGVKVLRPSVYQHHDEALNSQGKIRQPPMTPRDWSIMIGNRLHIDPRQGIDHILSEVRSHGNAITQDTIANGSYITRIGRDLYVGTAHADSLVQSYKSQWSMARAQHWPAAAPDSWNKLTPEQQLGIAHLRADQIKTLYPDHRIHWVDTQGHSDGTFCPVVPGLIVTLKDIQNYAHTFPGWEVIELPDQSWEKIKEFMDLKRKNKGKWWVPGEELNHEFTDYVENWLDHWVGYVEETVFDVNMLVIDRKNVLCTGYNQRVFDAFDRHGITAHIVNFRHRYFWDGGLHCITSDLDRQGELQDYFPERDGLILDRC